MVRVRQTWFTMDKPSETWIAFHKANDAVSVTLIADVGLMALTFYMNVIAVALSFAYALPYIVLIWIFTYSLCLLFPKNGADHYIIQPDGKVKDRTNGGPRMDDNADDL
jgi:hypothetical protein